MNDQSGGKFRRSATVGSAVEIQKSTTEVNDKNNTVYDVKALQERHRAIHEKMMRREIERDRALKDLEIYKKEAIEKFGVSDVDALKKIAEEQKQKEAEELEKFTAALDEAERVMNQIDEEMAKLND